MEGLCQVRVNWSFVWYVGILPSTLELGLCWIFLIFLPFFLFLLPIYIPTQSRGGGLHWDGDYTGMGTHETTIQSPNKLGKAPFWRTIQSPDRQHKAPTDNTKPRSLTISNDSRYYLTSILFINILSIIKPQYYSTSVLFNYITSIIN